MLPWDHPCWRCWSECEGKRGNYPFGDASSSRNGKTSILIPGNDWKCCLSVAVRLLTNRKPHQFQKWNSATPVVSRLLKNFGIPQEALLPGYLPCPRHVQQHLRLGGQGVHQRSDPAPKLQMDSWSYRTIGCCRQFLLEKCWWGDNPPPHPKQNVVFIIIRNHFVHVDCPCQCLTTLC